MPPALAILLLSLRIAVKPNYFLIILSPSLIFLCVNHIHAQGLGSRLLIAAGNMTYSSYLLHVPFQLAVVTCCSYLGLKIPFYSPYFFLAYIALILLLSDWSYRFLEMPAQRLIRRRLMPRTPAVTRSPP